MAHSGDRLSEYVYTDPRRARALLDRQARRLAQLPPQRQLGYYLDLANLETQESLPEEAERAYTQALLLADEQGDIATRLEVYLDYAGHLTNREILDRAADYLERCRELLSKFGADDGRMRARAHCRRAYLELNLARYPQATTEFFAAEQLLALSAEDHLHPKDHYFYCLVETGLGTVYAETGDAELARGAFRRAIERCRRVGLYSRLPWLQLSLGIQAMHTGDHEEAIQYFDQIIAQKSRNSRRALAAAYANSGVCYSRAGQPARARVCLERAEEIYRSGGTRPGIELALINHYRATVLMDEERWPEAIEQFLTVPPMLEGGSPEETEADYHPPLSDTYLFLSTCYAALDDYERAYRYHLRYDHYNQLMEAEFKRVQQRQFAAKHRVEEREQENRRLRLQTTQLQMKALRAQMNPHFLYNALNGIQSFILGEETAAASRHLAKFAMLMRRGLEYSDRERISLGEERRFLEDYLEINRQLRFDGELSYELVIEPDLEEDVIGVPTMILQPYVENAIEHGLRGMRGGHVAVTFRSDGDDYLLATVTDNGIGRQERARQQAGDATRSEHRSRGTEITEARLRLLAGPEEVWVRTEDLTDGVAAQTGTRVHVRFPVLSLPS